jgi:3-methyladenine DNA glycosylase AlkD
MSCQKIKSSRRTWYECMPYHVLIDVKAIEAEIDSRLRALPAPAAEPLRAIRRELSGQLAAALPNQMVELAGRLIQSGGFDRRFIAYELLSNHPDAFASLGESELLKLGRGISSWSDVDTFALYLAGPAWRERQISDRLIRSWARSPDRWWRRAALVSTVPLNSRARGGKGDTSRTLSVCRLLIADRDDMIIKALSWALRELAKRDQKSAAIFLARYQEHLAPRVIREVKNKLTTGLKNPKSTRAKR